MGMEVQGHELCYIHPALEGRHFDGDAAQWAQLCGDWSFPLWGGGKTWIAPESGWPGGAPHRDLDSLPWQVTRTWFDSESMGIEVQSPVCSQSGLQLQRRLTWQASSREWCIQHTVRNRGEHTVHCGIWDVLMLQRPGTVTIPLSITQATTPAVVALPQRAPIEELVDEGILQIGDDFATVICDKAKTFKCGFLSAGGDVGVFFSDWNIRYARHSSVHLDKPYAHGHPLEIFNAPQLAYFEVETHSPLQALLPGSSYHYAIFERID